MTDYHNMPGLSSSGARKLLPPSCPAKFKWELDNPPPPRDVFDFGHAAHRFVLGKGEEIARIDYPDRRTNAAKAAIADARENGLVPLLAKDYAVAVAMAKALSESPAGELFSGGEAEAVLRATDPETGVPLRSMFDYLRVVDDGRPTIVDYKSAESAEPGKFARAMFSHGYHIQDAFYRLVAQLRGHDDPRFIFVAQEKTPPYLATTFEFDATVVEIGRRKVRQAIDLYARCLETDTWPGYADDVVTVNAPSWAINEYLDSFAPDDIQAA